MVCRVVSRSVPLPCSAARSCSAIHCAGVSTPPGMRTRAMKMNAFSSFFLARSRAQVAVVLLVDAVELRQLLVVLGDPAGYRLAQPLGDGAAQEAAVGLDGLVA